MRSPLLHLASLLTLLASASAAFAQSPIVQAEALLDQGEYLAAERLIESLALAKKPNPVAVWELSRVRTAQHQTEEGIKLAEKAIKLDDSQARFHAQLGAALMAHIGSAERLEQSTVAKRMRKSFEKALALDPENAVALLGLSRYYWSPAQRSPADLAKAVELAERARKHDPFKAELELGGIRIRKNDLKGALAHFEAASELKPNDADTHIACANILLRLERQTDARQQFEIARRLAPNSAAARAGLEALDAIANGTPAKR